MTTTSGTMLLRDRSGSQQVSYLELFFDLVFVFAVTRLSHTLLEHLSWAGAVGTLVLLMAVWWAWNFTAWFTNWFEPTRLVVRLVVLAIMLASLLMSAALPQAFGGRGVLFVIAYLAIQMGRHVFVVISLRGHQLSREFARALCWFGLSALAWAAGLFVHGWARIGLWALAVVVEYAAAAIRFPTPRLGRASTSAWTISPQHLVERCRLFLIIALGESILTIGGTFGDRAFDTGRTVAFVLAFLATVTMWWIYFALGAEAADSAIESARDVGRLGLLTSYVHVVIVAGVIVGAVGDELVISHPTGHTGPTTALVIVAGPALFLAGHALFKRLIFGYLSLRRVIGVLVLAVMMPLGTQIPPLALAAAATAVLIAVAAADVAALRASEPVHPST